MNTRLAVLAAVLAAMSAPAFAGDNQIKQLSQQTGLSERHVRMIVGNRTPYPEYRYVYDRQLKKFKAGIGEANYQRLISGQPMLLPVAKPADTRVASVR